MKMNENDELLLNQYEAPHIFGSMLKPAMRLPSIGRLSAAGALGGAMVLASSDKTSGHPKVKVVLAGGSITYQTA